MKCRKKAVVAGHICLDITPVFPAAGRMNMESVLAPGKLIHMEGVDIHTGGAVANTGLAMKTLGTDVSLMGKVGYDGLGRMVLDILEQYGAGEGMMASHDALTSYSIVLAMPGIDRIFLHHPGANDSFGHDDLDWEAIGQASLFHFGYPALMKKMYQQQGKELLRILKRVKALNVPVSLDMAAIDASSAAALADWDQILERILPYVDFFVPSIEELCFMIDREKYRRLTNQAEDGEITDVLVRDDLQSLGMKILSYGANVALIKCGAPGMYYKTSGGGKMGDLCARMNLDPQEWIDQEGFEASYEPDAVISGTGAGDSSIAAFLVSALNETSLAEALRMATAAGASCVAAYDALSGLKSLDELRQKIGRGWKKKDVAI